MYTQFSYQRPQTYEECFALMAKYGGQALLYAGGTDLLVQLRAQLVQPEAVLDVKGLPGLKDICREEGFLRIGAAATLSDILRHPAVQDMPLLTAALRSVGSVQIRHKATLAGNIQNASPAGDGLVGAWALDAELLLRSAGSSRRLAVAEYVQGPRRTALRQGQEMIEAILIPLDQWDRQRFFKIGRRNALAISVVNGGVALRLDENSGAVKEARVVLGAVAPTPLRITAAEELLRGLTPAQLDGAAIAPLISQAVQPISDIRASADYRRYISGVMVERTVRALLGGDEA